LFTEQVGHFSIADLGHFSKAPKVAKGFASITYLHNAAQAIASKDKPAYIYCLTDWDPSGFHIARTIDRRLHEFAPDADITFKRIAVTPEQIEEWKLETRPTKTSDSRARNFPGGQHSVDLDAIEPGQLRSLVAHVIEQHIDPYQLRMTKQLEALERQNAELVLRDWRKPRPNREGGSA
jgi:hypothetical protein